MSTPRLSVATANRLAAGAYIADHDVRGLYLRRRANVSTWSYVYRIGGEQRRLTLGRYPTVSISDARELAAAAVREIAAGRDPALAKRERREAPTVAELMDEYGRRPQLRNRAAKTARSERAWHALIVATIGRRRVTELSVDDLDAVKTAGLEAPAKREASRAAAAGRTPRPVPPGRTTANRCLVQLCAAMKWAAGPPLKWSVPDPRPLKKAVELFPERRRGRQATPAELAAAWPLIEALEDRRQARAMLAILMTGARVNEILRGRRADVLTTLRGRAVLVLANHKTARTGEYRRIGLPPAVVDMIGATDDDGSGLLFGAVTDNQIEKTWRRIRAKVGAPDLQLRDFRTTFASIAQADDVGLAEIGGLLGHKSAQTTRGYTELLDDKRGALSDGAAARVAALLKPSTTAAHKTRFVRRRKMFRAVTAR